jgi:hypothetical protein
MRLRALAPVAAPPFDGTIRTFFRQRYEVVTLRRIDCPTTLAMPVDEATIRTAL